MEYIYIHHFIIYSTSLLKLINAKYNVLYIVHIIHTHKQTVQ